MDIVFGAQYNTVGGTTVAARNLISGNLNEGVLIGFAGTANNVVEGNFIGTDATGKNFLASQQQLDGVYVGLGAGSNTIGGQNPVGAFNTAAWNVISGNSVNGILVTDSGTTGTVISGNFIGTDATGTAALPNGGNGITIAAGTSGTTVGAETSGIANLNVISGNLGDGLSITSSSGNNVSFDYIGVDLNNQKSVPNRGNGVSIHAASGNRVNLDVIRNNGGYGILTDTGSNHNAWYYDSIYNNTVGGITQPTNATPPAGTGPDLGDRHQRADHDHRDGHRLALSQHGADHPVVRQPGRGHPRRHPGPHVHRLRDGDDRRQRQRLVHHHARQGGPARPDHHRDSRL